MNAAADATYQERIQRAIDYIEGNLTRDPSLGDAARVACWSAYHFMRTFHAITGSTVAEYIRERRLDLAAYRLVFSRDRILDIALEVGYETQEAFTRAFKRCYGSSPGRYRAAAAYTIRRVRIDVKQAIENLAGSSEEGGSDMTPQITRLGPLHIMGAELRTTDDGSNFREIPQFWERFLQERTFNRIASKLNPAISYGLCTKADENTGAFSYVIGCEVAASAVPPAGLGLYDVPEKTYAVFTARGRMAGDEYSKAIQGMWKYAYGEWLPTSREWERDEGDDFELYDERRMGDGESDCEICIPVRPKT